MVSLDTFVWVGGRVRQVLPSPVEQSSVGRRDIISGESIAVDQAKRVDALLAKIYMPRLTSGESQNLVAIGNVGTVSLDTKVSIDTFVQFVQLHSSGLIITSAS